MDYPLQPPDGWVGASPDFGEGEKGAKNISDSEKQRVWKSFERRPVSRAEARALWEVRLSRGVGNVAWGSGARSAMVRESAMRMRMPKFSSDGSISTSRGTTEDNASDEGSLPGSTSAMSIDTVSSSLHQPSSETTHPKRRGKTPTMGTESNTSSNVSVSWSAGHEQRRCVRSRSGRPSSPSPGNKRSEYVREPDYSTAPQQQQQRQGRGSTRQEERNRFVEAKSKLSSSETAQRRNPTLHHGPGGDGAESMPSSSSPGKTAPPWASDLSHDQNDEAPPESLVAGGVRSGGEGVSPSPTKVNVPPPNHKSATAPAPTSLLRLGLSSESLFRLNGEADADSVLRAMVRLSSTPRTGTSEANGEKRGPPSHHTSGGAPGKRPAASGSRSNNGTAPAAPASRTLRSPEAGNHGVCRGNTPSIKSGQGHTTNAVGSPSPAAPASVLDIEGRPFQYGTRMRRDGLASSRASEPFDAVRHGGPVEGRKIERSGRKTAPQMGRRRRSSHDRARVAVGGRKVVVLSESQSEPSGLHERTKQRPLSSNIGGSGGREGAGGRMSTESLPQTLSRLSLTRQGSIVSLTVSSTSGASQQPPRSTSNGALGGQGFDLRSESIGVASDEPRRGTASRSEVTATEGSRERSRRQQQQNRPHAIPKAAVHEDPGGGKPWSGSQIKIRTESQVSTKKPSEDDSTARASVTTKRSHLVKTHLTGDGTDDGDDEGDGEIKTSRKLSEIIAGVTDAAALFVVPPRRDSRANDPPVLAETGRPTPPAVVEEGARNVRGGERGANGCATTSNSSSRLPGGASPNDRLRPGKSSSHHRRQPMGVTAPEKNGAAETRAAASVTDMGAIAGLKATMTPAAGGGREEGSPAKDDGASRGLVIGTAAAYPNVESREVPSGTSGDNSKLCNDVRRSHNGKGASSSSYSRNNAERTTRSGGGSPNSQGSGASRPSSNRGDSNRGDSNGGDSNREDSNARGSTSPQKKQQILDDKKSGATSLKTTHTEEPRPLEDVSCKDTRTEVSLPRLDKPEAMSAVSGAKQDVRQHSSIAEETQPPAATASPEHVVEPQKLPRISGAGGGRSSKTAGQHAIKVHSRPARVESKDLQTTTEALTTHHLTVDELLKVR